MSNDKSSEVYKMLNHNDGEHDSVPAPPPQAKRPPYYRDLLNRPICPTSPPPPPPPQHHLNHENLSIYSLPPPSTTPEPAPPSTQPQLHPPQPPAPFGYHQGPVIDPGLGFLGNPQLSASQAPVGQQATADTISSISAGQPSPSAIPRRWITQEEVAQAQQLELETERAAKEAKKRMMKVKRRLRRHKAQLKSLKAARKQIIKNAKEERKRIDAEIEEEKDKKIIEIIILQRRLAKILPTDLIGEVSADDGNPGSKEDQLGESKKKFN